MSVRWQLMMIALVYALTRSTVWADDVQSGQFRAVVAGVTNYKGDLAPATGEPFALGTGARRIEAAFRDYARRLGYSDGAITIVLLVDDDPAKEAPDRRNVITKLTDAALAASQPGDTFVFYFTGHGSRDGRGMFLYGSGADDVVVADRIEMAYVTDAMNLSHAGTKLVFVDACQVPKTGLAPNRSPLLDTKELSSLRTQGLAWFFASGPNEIAYIAPNGIGYFTNELETALARVSASDLRYADDLAQHLRNEVSRAVAGNPSKRRYQFPFAVLDGVGARFDLFRLQNP